MTVSDIVDRLQDARAFLSVSDLREIEVCNEAAAEIKRLRANQAGLLNEHEAYEKEIERLTAEVKSSFEDGWNAYADLIMEDRIEMEREEAWEKRVSGRES